MRKGASKRRKGVSGSEPRSESSKGREFGNESSQMVLSRDILWEMISLCLYEWPTYLLHRSEAVWRGRGGFGEEGEGWGGGVR